LDKKSAGGTNHLTARNKQTYRKAKKCYNQLAASEQQTCRLEVGKSMNDDITNMSVK